MNTPTRRRLLAAASAFGAGCVDETQRGSDPPSGTDADDEPQTGDSWCSTPHGSCPDYGDRVERVVCYDGGSVDSDTVLKPSADAVAEGESISFALENESGETLQTNFYNWRVDKCVGDEWYHVAPLAVNQPLMTLYPGESHTWTATIDNDDLEDGTPPRSGGTEDLTLLAVGEGHYAFRARGWFKSESREEDTAFAATFDLEGDSGTRPVGRYRGDDVGRRDARRRADPRRPQRRAPPARCLRTRAGGQTGRDE